MTTRLQSTFWRPEKDGERWLAVRWIDGARTIAKSATGRDRIFSFYDTASVAADRLNDAINNPERANLLAAGEHP